MKSGRERRWRYEEQREAYKLCRCKRKNSTIRESEEEGDGKKKEIDYNKERVLSKREKNYILKKEEYRKGIMKEREMVEKRRN